MRLFLILSILASSIALAEPLHGPSYIGMCSPNFPCERALKALETSRTKAIGYLADAFGHECGCVRQFLNLPGGKYVRVHLANGTCFPERKRRCGRLDVFYNETRKSAQRKLERRDPRLLKRYRQSILRTKRLLGEEREEVTLRYSLCLECPISNRARGVLLREALRHFPKGSIVDSPLNHECLRGLICEKHGDSMVYAQGQRCISDNDGIPLFKTNFERLRTNSAQCEAIFYWTHGFNLLEYEYSGPFIPPPLRTTQVSQEELEGVKACLGS